MHNNMPMVAHRCHTGYSERMEETRPYSWWLIAPDDDDLKPLVESVARSDWVAFAGDEEDPHRVPPVYLQISKAADGRKICTGLIVGMLGQGGAVEVNSRTLRGIPISELIGRATHADKAPAHHSWARDWVVSRAPDVPTVKRNPGPKGHPIEHFEAVAEMYRRALVESPRAPIVWLTRELHADRSTVTRWLKRARVEGFLGEATPGKAGETPTQTGTTSANRTSS